jgi:beta-glucosidase
METRIQELLGQMTLEEKVQLTTGKGFWHTHGVERLGVPSIAVNDGPSGLRKPLVDNELGATSVPATCFPAAEALASSWDCALVEEIGQALAEECLANDVQVLLGPGVNMKRTPLGGRCFEYYSEDPVLAGELGSAFVNGVQSKGVGTSLKHFAANNQEYERMTISAEIDQRTLREIYLAAFERVVRKAKPWTVMAAYNKVNGVYASEHPELLRQILKTEWGYDGVVVSDWGAVNEKEKALAAGLDLEMPGRPEDSTARIVKLVQNGTLAEEVIDEAAGRVLRLIFQGAERRQPGAIFDQDAHHALARRAAAESMVLLKNEDQVLPLRTEAGTSLAIIGRFAKSPRYQGAGSAKVNPLKVDNAYDELQSTLGENISLRYADGYEEDGSLNRTLLQEAVEAARAARCAIIFAGLTDQDESEGFDRPHLDMSEAHNRLIEEVCRVQPNTVVVLCSGSAVTMPWIDGPKAVLKAGLGGQAAGGAIADVLLGRVNPSGKLAETFARRLEDTPAYLNYPGEAGQVRYGEGLFIGYRYYDNKKIKPLFPFGYGLSYTTFEYTGMRLSQPAITDQEKLEVTVTVRNTGTRAGKEVVQLYVRDLEASVVRPEKELKAFAKVTLEPGEEKEVRLALEPRDFAFYDSELRNWHIESGEFEILIGASSEQIMLRAPVTVNARQLPPVFNKWQPLKKFFAHPKAAEVLISEFADRATPDAGSMDLQMLFSLPLVKLAAFGALSEAQVDALVEQINQAVSSENN